MKTSAYPLSYLLLWLCLSVLSCSKPATFLPQEGPPPLPPAECAVVSDTLATCRATRMVKDSCAQAWLKIWMDHDRGKQGFGATYQEEGIIFPNTDIQTLLDGCPTCTGVRVYFGFAYTGSDSVLSMILVNLNDQCDDVYGSRGVHKSSGLLYKSTRDSFPRFIDQRTAETHVWGWKNLFGDTASYGFKNFTMVSAYNYRREVMRNLATPPGYGVAFKIGVHAVEQNELFYYDLKSPAWVHDILIQAVDTNHRRISPYFNFAMPCPRFCGNIHLDPVASAQALNPTASSRKALASEGVAMTR